MDSLVREVRLQLVRALIVFLLLVSSSKAEKSAIGVYLDSYDHFTVAVSNSPTEVRLVAEGCFEVESSSTIRIEPCRTPLASGKVWQSLILEDENAATLLNAAFGKLKQLPKAGILSNQYEECVIATPVMLSLSQRDLLSSAASMFACGERPSVVHAPIAIVSALGIEPPGVEDAPVVIVMPSGVAYVLGEEEYEFQVISEFPPPLDLGHIISTHNISQVVIIQSGDSYQSFSEAQSLNGTPVRYEHVDIIPKGAALLAFSQLPQEPVTILPLSLGAVMYGSLLHTIIPRFAILPRRADITLTTVHHNQRVATIEIREGSRPRADDNLPLATLVLEGLPPAQAGTLQIQVSVEVDRYLAEVSIEAFEPKSGMRIRKVVERGVVLYEEGVLEAYEASEKRYQEEDAEFLDKLDYRTLEATKDETAVRTFEGHPKHEEL